MEAKQKEGSIRVRKAGELLLPIQPPARASRASFLHEPGAFPLVAYLSENDCLSSKQDQKWQGHAHSTTYTTKEYYPLFTNVAQNAYTYLKECYFDNALFQKSTFCPIIHF